MTTADRPRLLLIGLGGLGGTILEFVAREPGFGPVLAADRDAQRGRARVNLARVGALAQGIEPELAFVPIDLNDVQAVADLVGRRQPDIILSTASLQTWWLIDVLPPPAAAPLKRARFGAWLPVHLALTQKLMEALQAAGYQGVTLTAPFPDVVNVVLARTGRAPTCGVGNVDEIVPKVQHLAAARLGRVPLDSVRVFLVGHHALEAAAFGAAGAEVPPHYLRVEHDGRDVTGEVDAEALLRSPWPLPAGPAWHFLTAATTLRLLRALGGDRARLLHVPAPNGLPGGYPVLASRAGVVPHDLPDLSLAEAIALNERAHVFDGVEGIDPDGTVRISADSAEALRETLGYNGRRVPPSEAGLLAEDLLGRFRAYAAAHGVDLERIVSAL